MLPVLKKFGILLSTIVALLCSAELGVEGALAQESKGVEKLPAKAAPKPLPNFVIFLIDDLGWTDLGCYGSKFYETPQIDALAATGMRFTHAYSACTVCSPTRAALLTGKYPARLRITDWIPGHARPHAILQVPEWTKHLPLEEITLAEALKPAGYRSASIGKWHLGSEEYYPIKNGFELQLAGSNQGQPPSYFDPYKISTLENRKAGEYLTDRLTNEATAFIDEHKTQPFLLYLPHFGVHTPLQAKDKLVEKYQAKAADRAAADSTDRHKNAKYAAMIESVDDSVGQIVKKLDELKLREQTVIIFTSDNGGLLGSTSNAPLRAGKGSAYEGGVRVPLIINWPEANKVADNSSAEKAELAKGGNLAAPKPASTNDTPVITMDLFPTCVEIAGVNGDAMESATDGLSLASLLQGHGELKRDSLYWHYPHYHPGGATPYSAVRHGDLRLIEFHEDERLELYDLKKDPGEQMNVADRLPDRRKQLYAMLTNWRERVGAQMPKANPNHDDEKNQPKQK